MFVELSYFPFGQLDDHIEGVSVKCDNGSLGSCFKQGLKYQGLVFDISNLVPEAEGGFESLFESCCISNSNLGAIEAEGFLREFAVIISTRREVVPLLPTSTCN